MSSRGRPTPQPDFQSCLSLGGWVPQEGLEMSVAQGNSQPVISILEAP